MAGGRAGLYLALFVLPLLIASLVRIFPTTWAMEGILDLGPRGGGLLDILPEAGLLLGFAVVFFAVGLMRFRYEYCEASMIQINKIWKRPLKDRFQNPARYERFFMAN